MRQSRPRNLIAHELNTARAYQARYGAHPPGDRFAAQMRADNERDIAELEAEFVLSTAMLMADRLAGAGIHTREAAVALTIAERDHIVGVAAWSGYEDAAWQCALLALHPGSVAP
jgi:hypothetical protein